MAKIRYCHVTICHIGPSAILDLIKTLKSFHRPIDLRPIGGAVISKITFWPITFDVFGIQTC